MTSSRACCGVSVADVRGEAHAESKRTPASAVMKCFVLTMDVETPNDPKLSDGRGWRDRCVVGERRRPEAAGVTAAPVRCSAWLGVAVISVLLACSNRVGRRRSR